MADLDALSLLCAGQLESMRIADVKSQDEASWNAVITELEALPPHTINGHDVTFCIKRCALLQWMESRRDRHTFLGVLIMMSGDAKVHIAAIRDASLDSNVISVDFSAAEIASRRDERISFNEVGITPTGTSAARYFSDIPVIISDAAGVAAVLNLLGYDPSDADSTRTAPLPI